MMTQTDLQFLLKEGWRLIGINQIESPDGRIKTDNIIKAAHWWRIKLEIQRQIEIDKQNRRTIY